MTICGSTGLSGPRGAVIMRTAVMLAAVVALGSFAQRVEAQQSQEKRDDLDVTMQIIVDPDAKLPDEVVRRIPLPVRKSTQTPAAAVDKSGKPDQSRTSGTGDTTGSGKERDNSASERANSANERNNSANEQGNSASERANSASERGNSANAPGRENSQAAQERAREAAEQREAARRAEAEERKKRERGPPDDRPNPPNRPPHD
jgi:hypothetical protein